MSFLPIYNSWLVGAFLVSVFLWRVELLPLVVLLIACSVFFFWYDLINCKFHYEAAFWLFILSEVMAFGSLLACCVWFDCGFSANLSNPLEIPFLGCFLLLGSSMTVTGYHHLWSCRESWVLLGLTVFLGTSFIVLQLFELNEIGFNIADSSFHASSFCTVGLHFIHVVLGVVGLLLVLCLGGRSSGHYRSTLVTWYWHFVDYVWLLVYAVVYVC
uniref:Cytochrome c oxidase subunit 3 n=1 Tax=Haplobothrium globuliforme TaxID=108250 RepID=A0A8F7GMF6_9CEST|nr:cytochrome c oxidase subunit 3 [Haplobothrium globuliforme]